MAFRTRKPSNQVAPPSERLQNSSPTPLQNPDYHPDDFFTLCNILKDPKIQPGRPYKSYRTGIEPELGLIQAVLDHFNPSSKLLHCLIQWRICLERKENVILPVVYCLMCEEERLDLAVEISKEMRAKGYDIPFLCQLHRFEDAFAGFEDMLGRGIVPRYLTFHGLNDEFGKQGMIDLAWRLSNLMSFVSHSRNLPNKYNVQRNASLRAGHL